MENASKADSAAACFLLCEKDEKNLTEVTGSLPDLSLQIGSLGDGPELRESDIILVYSPEMEFGRNALEAIRSDPEVCLKPVAVFSYTQGGKDFPLADREIVLPAAPGLVRSHLDFLGDVAAKVRDFAALEEGLDETRIRRLLLLRFLHSRSDARLEPAIDPRSPVGYSHELARVLLGVAPGKETEALQEFEEARLLKGNLVDRIHLCPSCGRYQINFREICPSCRSLNFREEPTVHHFSCGCVSPEKNFTRGQALKCPKCSKELRHIGVDYDRPLAKLWCEGCGNNFLEPLVQCFCLSCTETFPPEEAVVQSIREYSVTAEGRTAAEDGTLPSLGLIDLLRREIGLYKLEIFREFFRIESLRCQRYGDYHSTLVRFRTRELRESFAQSGLKWTRGLRKELVELFKASFRNTDLLTLLNDDDILAILTHTNAAAAGVVVTRIDEVLHLLFRIPFDLHFAVLGLGKQEADLDQVLKEMK